jgi:hypothetical protein
MGVVGVCVHVGHEHVPSVKRLTFPFLVNILRILDEFLEQRLTVFIGNLRAVRAVSTEVTTPATEAGERLLPASRQGQFVNGSNAER